MSDPFVHLHNHCEYSFLDGFGRPSDFVSRCVELGQRAIAVTDHGNVSSHKKLSDAAKSAGVKPILGVEAYVCDDATKKSKERWHITLLAKDLVGYRNLLTLVTLSWERQHFYYKPRVDWAMLQQHAKGVVATSGCPSGRIGRGIAREGWDESRVVADLKRQATIFGSDYFAELSPWRYEDGIKIAESVYKAARREGIGTILTMDAHYPRPEDAPTQDIMLCINNNCLHSDPNRMKFSQDDFCLHSGDDMERKWREIHGDRLPFLDEMILNTSRIADSVSFEFPSALPLSYPYDGDKKALLREWCERGMKAKNFTSDVYRNRLEYEFDLACSKDFIDYFLVVTDLIVWAKDNGILVGPARGSSCGSLMCYVLRITEVDPIVHDLMFERFIDVSRKDMPDIDIDFDAERRHEVKEYLERKYGQNKVANLATFGTFKGKLCLQDIGRVFADKIPKEAVEEIKQLIVQRSSADSRAGFAVEDTFTNFDQAAEHLKRYPELGLAKKLEGQVRQLGIHAAGVVISNEPIENFAAMYVTSNGDRVMSMDYNDASSIGLLKIDILGLTLLSAIKKVLALVKERHGIEVDLGRVPLDDDAVYENFCRQNLQGIFQFEGGATRQVCRQVQPRDFEALVAINALSRPGPLHSGGTTAYIERRFGREKSVPLHPMLSEVTSKTYGITVYQEQVMQIVRSMGKFDWKETASIRKAMSKKLGDEFFGAMRKKFVEGAVGQGVDEKDAHNCFQSICTFGSWAFNKSHSVAYSIMAYHTMWLKTHFPVEFYAGAMACESDNEKRARLLVEYAKHHGAPLPVDINKSGTSVTCDGEKLRLGFDSVREFGEELAGRVVAGRPYKDFVDFSTRCKMPEAQANKLLRIGAFRELNFETITRQQDLFGAHKANKDGLDYKNPTEADMMEWCPTAMANKTFENWSGWLKKNVKGKVMSLQELDNLTERTDVLVLGTTNKSTQFNLKNKMEEASSRGEKFVPKEGEEHLTKEHYNFLNFDMEDGTDQIIVRISHKLYPRFKDMLWNIKPNEVLGVQGSCNGIMRMVFATSVVNLTELKKKLESKAVLTKDERDFVTGATAGPQWKKKGAPMGLWKGVQKEIAK